MKKRIITTLLAAAMTAAFATPALATEADEASWENETSVEEETSMEEETPWEKDYPKVVGENVVTQSSVQNYVTTPRVETDGKGNTNYSSVTTIGADNNRASSSMETTLTGTIQATQLKVTVPAAIFFVLDPTVTEDQMKDAKLSSGGENTNYMTQAIQPTIHITNGSLVPVYAKITKVDVKQGANDNNDNMGLVNNPTSMLQNSKMLMFAFKEKGVITSWNKKSDWLLQCADQEKQADANGPYLLSADRGRIEGIKYNSTSKSYDSDYLDMKIYARTYVGWHAKDSFTIIPTIVISVLNYSELNANNANSNVINSPTTAVQASTEALTEEDTPAVVDAEDAATEEEETADRSEELLEESSEA